MNARPQPLVGTTTWAAPATFKTPNPTDRVFDLIGSPAPDGPNFEDDVWDLSALPGWAAGNRSGKLVKFDQVPSAWRDLVKVACLFQFAPEVVGAHLRVDPQLIIQFDGGSNPATVQNFAWNFTYALNAALHAGKEDSGQFAGVTDWQRCALLIRHGARASIEGQVSGAPLEAATASTRARALLLAHRVAQVCGWEEPFGSVPFEGVKVDSFFQAAGQHRDPFNKVRPNPEVLTATAIAAFFFESGIAENIVDAAEWWANISAPADPIQAIADRKIELVRLHGTLPEGPNRLHDEATIGWREIAASVGYRETISATMKYRIAVEVCDAMGWPREGQNRSWLRVATAPMALCGVQPIKVRSRIDDVEREWCDPTEFNFGGSLDRLVTAVSMMAAVLLHGTTALRMNDRHFLDLDCVEEFTDTDGVERYRLHGWKTKMEPVPKKIDFSISPRLARALLLVKRLHSVLGIEAGEIRGLADHGIEGKHHLFARDLNRWNNTTSRPGEILRTENNLDGWVNEVRRWLVEAELVKPMDPLGHFSHREMRITVEQAHQRHDYGPALAAHLGAWSSERVQFGYIGDVRRRPMVEAESLNVFVEDNRPAREQRDAERGFMLLDLAARYDELNDAGQRRMTDIAIRHRENLNVENLSMLSEKQVVKALAAIGSEEQLGVTPFVACVYNPERALCDGSGYANPQDCRPAACANAIQTREMRAAYELERRALQWVVEMNPRSIFKSHLSQLAEDGEAIIAEFAEFTDDDLHALIVEGSMVGRAVPVDITPKEES